MKTYTAIVERCPETKLFVGYIPSFPGAHSQAATLDELNRNLRGVVELLCWRNNYRGLHPDGIFVTASERSFQRVTMHSRRAHFYAS